MDNSRNNRYAFLLLFLIWIGIVGCQRPNSEQNRANEEKKSIRTNESLSKENLSKENAIQTISAKETELGSDKTRNAVQTKGAGSICGEVCWEGKIPEIPDQTVALLEPDYRVQMRKQTNPNKPVITSQNRLAFALIYLNKTASEFDSPIGFPELKIETSSKEIRVLQNGSHHIGIVQPGQQITLSSIENRFQSLRFRGGDYCTLTLPELHSSRIRQLPQKVDLPEIIELSSGAGYYWTSGYLLLCPHPYATLSDQMGKYKLSHVPPGEYDLTLWIPNWQIERTEYDPEWAIPFRQFWAKPLVLHKKISILAEQNITLNWTIKAEMFPSVKTLSTEKK